MARQLAVKTVISWFGSLSFDGQRDALGQIQRAHDHSLSARRVELERQLAALGFAAPKKRGRPRAMAKNGGSAPVTRVKSRRAKVKAKYRDPKTGESWSGRGRMASWLKAKQDAGDKVEKYLV